MEMSRRGIQTSPIEDFYSGDDEGRKSPEYVYRRGQLAGESMLTEFFGI